MGTSIGKAPPTAEIPISLQVALSALQTYYNKLSSLLTTDSPIPAPGADFNDSSAQKSVKFNNSYSTQEEINFNSSLLKETQAELQREQDKRKEWEQKQKDAYSLLVSGIDYSNDLNDPNYVDNADDLEDQKHSDNSVFPAYSEENQANHAVNINAETQQGNIEEDELEEDELEEDELEEVDIEIELYDEHLKTFMDDINDINRPGLTLKQRKFHHLEIIISALDELVATKDLKKQQDCLHRIAICNETVSKHRNLSSKLVNFVIALTFVGLLLMIGKRVRTRSLASSGYNLFPTEGTKRIQTAERELKKYLNAN